MEPITRFHLPGSVPDHKGVKAVLSQKVVVHRFIPRHQANPAYSPVERLTPVHKLVQVHGLVRAVEAAHTEVDYACRDPCAVVYWSGHSFIKLVQGLSTKPHRSCTFAHGVARSLVLVRLVVGRSDSRRQFVPEIEAVTVWVWLRARFAGNGHNWALGRRIEGPGRQAPRSRFVAADKRGPGLEARLLRQLAPGLPALVCADELGDARLVKVPKAERDVHGVAST